ncbi:MAG: hypothetical protein IT330_16930 [Anaerolineae bacterium]|nr:hypothetical protein [Anaerolineae bacterium]
MKSNVWTRLNAPLKIALIFAALGIAMTLVGVARGLVPLNPASIVVALVLSGGSWGVVSWAIATAAVDSEQDTKE